MAHASEGVSMTNIMRVISSFFMRKNIALIFEITSGGMYFPEIHVGSAKSALSKNPISSGMVLACLWLAVLYSESLKPPAGRVLKLRSI